MKNILIIGCGLLGSSLLRRIQKKKMAKKIYIYEKSKSNIAKIKKLKLPGIIIKKLEDGIIKRKADPKDKRRSVIYLTKLGVDWRKVAKDVVIDFNNSIQSHFNKEEMDIFFEILKKINKIVDDKRLKNDQ